MALTSEQIEKFEKDGYLVMEDFLTEKEVNSLRDECYQLVEDMDPAEHHTVFSTTKHTHRDEYFIKSANRIGFFFEEGVLDDEGKLKVDKQRSLNKIGHTLHIHCPNFKKVTFSEQVKGIAKSLGYADPCVPQSMYIFKQPGIGGEVVPHQDGTYLHTRPALKVMGLWIALEDATLENGCLWFMPGSHNEGILGDYRMVRNENRKEDEPTCFYVGDKPKYDDSKFIATPVKKGSLIVIHGAVVHKSEKNLSSKSRHIYTFHMYDQGQAAWSAENWLQPTEEVPFPHLYTFQ